METDWIKVAKKRDNENQQAVSARKQSKSPQRQLFKERRLPKLWLYWRNSVDPENTQTDVKLAWRTKAGDVLVEIEDTSVNKGAFGNALKNILGENAVGQHLEPMATVDMDFITTV